MLSIVGIPLGLISGWLIETWLTPVVIEQLNGIQPNALSTSPLIFMGAAVFSLVTVFISCGKPGKTAAHVSPVEAVRYTGATIPKSQQRRARSGASLSKMALANLGRNQGQTIVTIISLSLAIMLLCLTFTFTSSFSIDDYLGEIVSDYIVADTGYFSTSPSHTWQPVEDVLIDQINKRDSVTGGGRVYGLTSGALEFVDFIDEDYYRSSLGSGGSELVVDLWLENCDKLNGMIGMDVQLSGFDDYALSKLTVLEGDISKLYEPGGNYIAAVYRTDDYGNAQMDTHWAKVGDVITIRYVEEWQYYDWLSGKPISGGGDESGYRKAAAYHDEKYEIAALVIVPTALSYRYFGPDAYVMNANAFIEATNTSDVMLYAFDTADGANNDLESLMETLYTGYRYESRESLAEGFYSLRNMVATLGGVLCTIIGFVGILNFLNAILTCILNRRREFAVLQAVGMTGCQLKTMLIWEGIFYTMGALVISTALSIVTAPLLKLALESIFWFINYQFTIVPVLVVMTVFAALGIMIPLVSHRIVARKSIVDRLREE